MCVKERKRERERERAKEAGGERKRVFKAVGLVKQRLTHTWADPALAEHTGAHSSCTKGVI